MAGTVGIVSGFLKATRVTNWHWSHWLYLQLVHASWTGVQQWRSVHVVTQGRTLEQVGSCDL